MGIKRKQRKEKRDGEIKSFVQCLWFPFWKRQWDQQWKNKTDMHEELQAEDGIFILLIITKQWPQSNIYYNIIMELVGIIRPI